MRRARAVRQCAERILRERHRSRTRHRTRIAALHRSPGPSTVRVCMSVYCTPGIQTQRAPPASVRYNDKRNTTRHDTIRYETILLAFIPFNINQWEAIRILILTYSHPRLHPRLHPHTHPPPMRGFSFLLLTLVISIDVYRNVDVNVNVNTRTPRKVESP